MDTICYTASGQVVCGLQIPEQKRQKKAATALQKEERKGEKASPSCCLPACILASICGIIMSGIYNWNKLMNPPPPVLGHILDFRIFCPCGGTRMVEQQHDEATTTQALVYS